MEPLVLGRLAVLAAGLLLAACSGGSNVNSDACSKVVCGRFDIQKTKESTPIFFSGNAPTSIYRLCIEQGSVILQTIESDANARSLGGEIRAGNCAEISFAEKIYIIGNTAAGRSAGFYYRVP